MNIDKELQNLIEGIKNEKWEYIPKLNIMFSSYTESIYNGVIGINFGNEYEADFFSAVELKLIRSVHTFKGSTSNEFYAYMNVIIKNCALTLLNTYIKPFHNLRYPGEFSENVNVTELETESVEEYVVSKMISTEILNNHLIEKLSTEERKALLNTLIGKETTREYALRRNYKEVTVRAYRSKAISKMRKEAKSLNLADKYFIYY